MALVALFLLSVGAGALYLTLGSPDLPAQPQAARREQPPEERSIADLVARVEAHLEANPEDGRGWEVIGPVYMRLGRYDDAVKARRNTLRLLEPTAVREADLGEALTAVSNGIVTAEAKAAFERAIARWEAVPQYARSGAPERRLQERVVTWAGELGGEDEGSLRAALTVVERGIAVTTPQSSSPLDARRSALHRALAEVLAPDENACPDAASAAAGPDSSWAVAALPSWIGARAVDSAAESPADDAPTAPAPSA